MSNRTTDDLKLVSVTRITPIVKNTINTNLLNLISQILNAWVTDQRDEEQRLENLAMEELQKQYPDVVKAEHSIWLYTTLSMFKIREAIEVKEETTNLKDRGE